MAQRVEVVLIDDIDGGNASETVTFGLDGVTYEIDLSDKNAAKLRDDLATWTGHARRAGSGSAKGAGSRRRSSGPKRGDLAAVREWARANGHDVSDRGRISSEVQAAYDKAH
ncbi:Lsr2 family protein [Terrabacter sp. NPDC000476]|uniref:histone-like nucleoid-structuring protein Lsr2 n=1 Tax=Terrabacter sp. NPDC000476 TaxID=3154258 RepID=UPI00331F89FC